MITQTDPLTIHYDVPGSFPGGRSLDETVLRPAMTHGGVGFVVDPGVRLSQKSYAMLARAARRLAREEGLSARSLTVRCMMQTHQRMHTGHDCTPEGDVVLDVTLDKQWTFHLHVAILRADDLVSGRFPSMHAAAREQWVDVLWAMSLEGRLASRGLMRRHIEALRAASTGDPEKIARDQLASALMLAGKARGLSLQMVESKRIAREVWGRQLSLHEIVALGEKYGFRLEGPLATLPPTDRWPRQLSAPPRRSDRESRASGHEESFRAR